MNDELRYLAGSGTISLKMVGSTKSEVGRPKQASLVVVPGKS